MNKIEWLICTDGERLPLLVSTQGIPLTFPNMFVMSQLRLSSKANTISNFLSDINHLILWEKINNRNLTQEFSSGKILPIEDIISIRDHCAVKVDSIKNARRKNIIDLSLYAQTLSKHERVKSHQQYRRFTNIRKYLIFLSHSLLKSHRDLSKLNIEISKMEKMFLKNNPTVSSNSIDPGETSANPKAFEKLMKVIHYQSTENPFKSNKDKIRNYLMIAVTYWTGLRAGELLSLKVENISRDIFKPYINIMRNHDDPTDTRKIQPTAKTLGRKIPIPKHIHELLWFYIDHIRSPLVKANGELHQFIFISHKGPTKGQPMSSVNYSARVLGTIKNMNDEFKDITRHGFRHYWNARYSQKIDERNRHLRDEIVKAEAQGMNALAGQLRDMIITENRELTFRQYLNGHRSKGSGEIYLKRHSAKLAGELSMILQEDYSSMLTNGEMAINLAESITQEEERTISPEELYGWI